jgi:hypothetical protein
MGLHALFGNQSVVKILFFLLVNGKCYAGKLARHFQVPLTPLQQALTKLETLGVLESDTEGKTRTFTFNPDYPLKQELESLLRKAYSLLSAQEKIHYYDPEIKSVRPKDPPKKESTETPQKLIFNVWNKLEMIRSLSFSANSQGQGNTGWNGIGRGHVKVKKQTNHTLVFEEQGSWISKAGIEFTFSNIFRWTMDRFKNLITLEHLRFGEHNPVFLFHLAQTGVDTLESVNSHICEEDTYLGQVRCSDHSLKLNWRIIGPKKNEEIEYIYS